MKKLLCFMMIISIIVSIYFISDTSIQNIILGNVYLDKEKVWELGLAISIGVFSSALLALLIEFVNERNKKIERDRILREMMWDYFVFNKHQLEILDKNELAKGTLFYLSEQITLNVFIEDYVKETYEKSRKYLDLFYLYFSENERFCVDDLASCAKILLKTMRSVKDENTNELKRMCCYILETNELDLGNYLPETKKVFKSNLEFLRAYKLSLERYVKAFEYLYNGTQPEI